MKLKTGYSFTTGHLFNSFNIKHITTHHSILKKHYKTREKKEMAVKVFLYAIYLVLLDIIENNVTFVLPTSKRAQIQMQAVTGDAFVKARKNGKFKEIDFIKSNYTGYQLSFYFQKKGFFKTKPIYVDKRLKQKIIDNTNNGMRYL